MIQKRIGRNSLTVFPVCLKATVFGDQNDTAEANRVIGYVHDSDVNFIDTAGDHTSGRTGAVPA